ncbi:MAG: hypothetical protein ACLQNE_01580 [Thermoguttaceae bacterium]
MSNKVTRRVAIGSVVGLAAAPLVLRALRAKYYVKLAEDSGTWKVPVEYRGERIVIEVPRMAMRTPEDEETFEAVAQEQWIKNPRVIEANKRLREEYEESKEREKRRRLAQIDADEKRELAEIARMPGEEKEKQDAARWIKEQMRACRTQAVEHTSSAP